MKNRLLLLALLLLTLLPFAAHADSLTIDGGTADRVHLRASPNAEAGSLGLYFTGTQAERLGATDDGWARVRIGSETGYVRTEYLTASAEAAFPEYAVDNPTSDWVNLRSGASFEAEPLGRLNNGDRVSLMGETASGWSYVQAGGQRGYVVSEFLSAAGNAEQPETAATQIVGTTADGGYIHAYSPDAAQTIYFVAREANPGITREDVNFDGHDDLVITTMRGATNFYYEFFVWTQNGYVRADYPAVIGGIANFSLDAEKRYVVSRANNGNAGAMYEDCILRWEGTSLCLVRRAVSQSLHEYRSEGASFVTTVYDRQLSLTVHSFDADGGSTLIYEEVIDMNRINADKVSEMKQRLWQGLR